MLTGRNFPYRAKTTANLRKYFKTTNKKHIVNAYAVN